MTKDVLLFIDKYLNTSIQRMCSFGAVWDDQGQNE